MPENFRTVNFNIESLDPYKYDPDILTDRGNCKTALPGKIDDFDARREWQRSCHSPFYAADPMGLPRRMDTKWPQKGDFNGKMSFTIGS